MSPSTRFDYLKISYSSSFSKFLSENEDFGWKNTWISVSIICTHINWTTEIFAQLKYFLVLCVGIVLQIKALALKLM